MNQLITKEQNGDLTMSSRELRDIINAARVEHGESKVRNDHLLARIEDEIGAELGGCKTFTHPQSGTKMRYYNLNQDQCLLVGMRESKAVRRNVLAKLSTEKKPKEPAWITGLSPQAKIALEDLGSQVDHYKTETSRLQTVCNDLALNLREGMTVVAFCRSLNGVNLSRVQPDLVARKRLLSTKHGYRSASAYRDKLFTERHERLDDGRLTEKVILTRRGAKWLYAEYENDRLAMKKGWNREYTHILFDDVEVAA